MTINKNKSNSANFLGAKILELYQTYGAGHNTLAKGKTSTAIGQSLVVKEAIKQGHTQLTYMNNKYSTAPDGAYRQMSMAVASGRFNKAQMELVLIDVNDKTKTKDERDKIKHKLNIGKASKGFAEWVEAQMLSSETAFKNWTKRIKVRGYATKMHERSAYLSQLSGLIGNIRRDIAVKNKEHLVVVNPDDVRAGKIIKKSKLTEAASEVLTSGTYKEQLNAKIIDLISELKVNGKDLPIEVSVNLVKINKLLSK